MKKFFSSRIIQLLVFSIIVISVYFINVEVQTHFGKQALEKTGLVSIPFKEALKKAKIENKLVLVDVSAIWCSTCRKLDNDVFSDTDVKRFINKNLIFSRIEYESEEGQNFLEFYKASGFPTLFLIDKDGRVVKRLAVTFDPTEFMEQLRK